MPSLPSCNTAAKRDRKKVYHVSVAEGRLITVEVEAEQESLLA